MKRRPRPESLGQLALFDIDDEGNAVMPTRRHASDLRMEAGGSSWWQRD